MTTTNQNIAELIMQARVATTRASMSDPHKCNPGSDYFRALEMKTFATLLLNECLTFIEPMAGSGGIDNLALNSATVAIKEHFSLD